MAGFLDKLFGGDKKRYETQKKKLTSGNAQDRAELAASSETHPEILYYLAKDGDPLVRKSVAVNKATPVHASTLLANDKSVDVRTALAARLVELLPDLSDQEHSQLYAYAVQALATLAQDEVLKIRQALSGALKDYAKAPPQVAGQLARDVEREVSEPILRYCVALSDDDLLGILSDHPQAWVISAIASRPVVSEKVSEAVVDTKDIPANTILISNTGAKLSSASLQKIIEHAKECPEWHAPIALRKELSMDLARQLTGFVNESVLSVLEKRSDFDPETRQDIANLVKRRIEYQSRHAPNENADSKLERYIKSGKLSADVVEDALGWEDKQFVILALAHLANIHPVVVDKMLKSGSAKPIIALCWKARLPMRLAVTLQRDLAKLPQSQIVYAKGGTDYPLSREEVKWQLEFYGIDTKN